MDNKENYLPRELLRRLFYETDIKNVTRSTQPPPPPQTPQRQTPHGSTKRSRVPLGEANMTPISKMIASTVTPGPKRARFIRDIQRDDLELQKQEVLQDYDDPDYQEKLEQGGIGILMENFLVHYGHCPICGQQTLRKYGPVTMPVVDLVCSNVGAHQNSCRLWQVKVSAGTGYFNVENSMITVGSKAKGYNAHQVLGTDGLQDKLLVPGYICISLHRVNENMYRIVDNESFVLIPQVDVNATKFYYRYTGQSPRFPKKSIITWDQQMVNKLPIARIVTQRLVDTRDYYLESAFHPNPYQFPPLQLGGKRYMLVK